MSSLEGDTAVSGNGNLINIEIKYRDKPYFFEFKNTKSNEKILSNFKEIITQIMMKLILKNQ